jgi:hypothetical protein
VAALDTTDRRVQLILRALRSHPDHSSGELWWAALANHGDGYGPTAKTGRFNFGYMERTLPRLRKEGYVFKGKAHRMTLTEKGEAAILPLVP